jgi:Ser/Thr protein kinase RdoA (MazF antagonist)
MPLRPQALFAFELPAAPQREDELTPPLVGIEACKVSAPAGAFLLLCSENALGLAFEATFFDLLAESRFPVPPPRRSTAGSLVAKLKGKGGHAAAASCYSWPPGEPLLPEEATAPQLLEVGRLFARLHQLGDAHPASVADPADGATLVAQLPASAAAETLAPVLRQGLPRLPTGALHGWLRPQRVLFIGDRCSAVLPTGRACSGPFALDLAEAAVGWVLAAARPAPALRALLSGYQALRRLLPEERDGLFAALRYAAAREGARRLAFGEPLPLAPLRAADALGEAETLAATGG